MYCIFCERDFLLAELCAIKNGYVCRDCSYRLRRCNQCGQIIKTNDYQNTKVYREYALCKFCQLRSDIFADCLLCNKLSFKPAMFTGLEFGRRYCDLCVCTAKFDQRPLRQCCHCSYVYPRLNTKLWRGNWYCEACCPSTNDFRYSKDPNLTKPSQGRNDLLGNTYCGIEIECFHEHRNGDIFAKKTPHWGWVRDGSLSQIPETCSPLEFLSPILWGNAGLMAVVDFLSTLKTKYAGVNISCGLHVHVQSNDLNVQELKNVISTWQNLEPWILNTVPVSRRVNPTCLPLEKINYSNCQDERQVALALYGLLPTTDPATYQRVKSEKYHNRRYRTLNIHSHFYRGTLEFRLHPGTLNFKKIRHWMELCSKIVSLGKQKENWNKETFLAQLDKSTVCHFQDQIKRYSRSM